MHSEMQLRNEGKKVGSGDRSARCVDGFDILAVYVEMAPLFRRIWESVDAVDTSGGEHFELRAEMEGEHRTLTRPSGLALQAAFGSVSRSARLNIQWRRAMGAFRGATL
jgi:hypothetical protein